MNKNQWITRIKQQCNEIGTYREAFDPVIETLADTLIQRDIVYSEYTDEGSHPTIRYTNQGGNENESKNPKLILWMDLNKQALAYWKDLGLTPAGLKRINEDLLKNKTVSKLEEAMLASKSRDAKPKSRRR